MPVRVDPGWIVVFTLIAVSVSVIPELHAWSPWFGCCVALGMMLSIAVHECSHILVARRMHVHVAVIRIHFLGVTASLGRYSSPLQEILVAIVGPLTSLALAAVFVTIALTARTSGSADPLANPISALSGLLGVGNAAVTGWNLLPVFPLDGGRVVHGVLWKFTGDAARAANVASRITIVACGIGALALGATHQSIVSTFRYGILLCFLMYQGGVMAPREFARESAQAQTVDG